MPKSIIYSRIDLLHMLFLKIGGELKQECYEKQFSPCHAEEICPVPLSSTRNWGKEKMETSERKDVDSCDCFFIPPVKLVSIYSPHHPGSFSQNWGLSKTSVSCCYATKKGPKYYARHFEKTSLHELELYVKGWRDSFDFR